MFQQARQGDIFFTREDALPEGAISVPRDKHGNLVVAEGKATGHIHHVQNRKAELYLVGAILYLKALERITLLHQEHGPVEFDPGIYKVTRQREYTPAEIRQVAD